MSEIFNFNRGHFHSIKDLTPGPYPTISRISEDNGFVGFYDKPNERTRVLPPSTITVSTVTGDSFVQPVPFIATDNVVLCTPKPQYRSLRLSALFFIAQMINQVKWRYSYGRQCYMTKFANTEIFLPIDRENRLDVAYMATLVESTSYWPLVKAIFDEKGDESP